MKKLIIATKNEGKAREFRSLFPEGEVEVLSLLDLEEPLDVEETGNTFTENAILKAEEISRKYQTTVIADDSGLEIDYLNGAPGVYSARYAGAEKNDQDNINKVLKELSGVPANKRTARFVCALAVSSPGKETKTVTGTVDGYINEQREGNGGFGYDPIFFVKDKCRTMAELTKEEKNAISHRANALEKLQGILPEYI
ncbi:XTP/dITP diphosphatase [Bacillus lacus]|uniref:dITP/XTP pyrophosphatase n=1 Tax=Metabacillus lacus TaxID=1983721 RepID=A0A7X2IZ44_9BACI|nr:XTP/dITP diphosphatase [Metabacillus lacus]MRX71818.1 XTP/dITP diphosphatase [Metabacillus lacus]